ncbi:MAG TPA: alpha/beta hydrolase [Arenimonas sp.]|uniref:alpha/beta fold hydrolase n=1 Tax=Arenimonas sp. TaxID=1872635 RepID=UPI002C528C6C|nr:alpha/beta hydrolase [Arenimonas sp.]HMB57294.1 alpha/beta hydrolase [Arenimonas sp.]
MQEISLTTARGPITALRGGTPGGPRVLALHGWLDNAASFLPLHEFLPRLDLVALDLPGHGGSAHRLPGYDYVFVDWIHDVLDALDALGWSSAALLGHSMGGAIATVVAASAPERVEKLALIEALGPISGIADEAGARLRQAVAARRALDPARAARVIPDIDTAVDARLAASKMSRDAARLIVERNLRPVEDGFVWRSDPRLTLPTHVRTDEGFVRSWIRAIEAPVLVIAADPAPPYFNPAIRAGRLAELRDGRVEVIAGGHHLHMEQPERVAEVLRKFLLP